MKINKINFNKDDILIFLKKIFFGILMGFSDGVPGYSGGTTLSMLKYDTEFIFYFKNLFIKRKIKIWILNVYELLPFVVAWILSLFLFSYITSIISKQGVSYQILLFLFFFMLSLSSIFIFYLVNIYKKIKWNSIKNNISNLSIISFFAILLISIGIGVYFLGGISLEKNEIDSDKFQWNEWTLMIIISSFLAGFCMLIPGISGSFVLFIFNTYKDIYLNIINNILENYLILIVVIISILLGFLLSIFTINFLIKKYKSFFNLMSFGLVVGSPFSMLIAFLGNKNYSSNLNNLFINNDIIIYFCLIIFAILIFLLSFIYAFYKKNQNKNIIKNDSVLLVVDMQNDFYIGGSLEVKNSNKITYFINEKIREFRQKNKQIIFSQDYHPKDHISFKEWNVHCVQNDYGSNIIPELNVDKKDLIVQKGTNKDIENYSAFYDGNKHSNLLKHLKENNIKNIYIVGLAGDFCVKETAIDAIKNNFCVIFLAKGIKSIDKNFDLSKVDESIVIE